MSMTDDARGDGEAQAQDTSFSSGNGEGSLAPDGMSYTKDWGRNGYLVVTYSVRLQTKAVGAIVLLSGAGQGGSLGQLPANTPTTFTGTRAFTETQRASMTFEVISGPNNIRQQFDVLAASFTP